MPWMGPQTFICSRSDSFDEEDDDDDDWSREEFGAQRRQEGSLLFEAVYSS